MRLTIPVEDIWEVNIENSYKLVRKSTAHKYVIHKRINIDDRMHQKIISLIKYKIKQWDAFYMSNGKDFILFNFNAFV